MAMLSDLSEMRRVRAAQHPDLKVWMRVDVRESRIARRGEEEEEWLRPLARATSSTTSLPQAVIISVEGRRGCLGESVPVPKPLTGSNP